MNNLFKSVGIWLVVALVLMTVFNQFNARQQSTAQAQLDYSQFLDEVKAGHIEKVTIEGRTLKATTTDGKRITTYAPSDLWLVSDLLKNGVKIEAKPEEEQSFLMSIFVSWFPMLLLIGVWIFFMRQMQGGKGGGAFSFGKSKARMLDDAKERVTFADVAGCDEAKEEVSELVDFLRDPTKFQNLGGRIPRGVLMVGSPGTGKTLLAKAIAGEAKVPFFSISGSDFVEMFVGVGAARVRDMFEQAKKQSPCIVFIDEIDAVGRQRGAGLGGGNDEREQTLNAVAGGNGRFRRRFRRDRHRRHQPSRRARPGAVAPGPFRPPGRGAVAGYPRPRADPDGAYAQGAGGARREGRHPGARNARHVRCRSGQSGERSGLVCGAPQQALRRHGRFRGGQGQDHHGRGAQVHDHAGRGAPQYGLSRVRPRRGRQS